MQHRPHRLHRPRRRKLARKAVWYVIVFAPLGLSIVSGIVPRDTVLERALALALLAGGFLLASWWNRYFVRDRRAERMQRRLGLDPWKDFSPQWYLYPED